MVGRVAASGMASASGSSFFCALTYGRTYSGDTIRPRTVTPAINSLEQNGLVSRSPVPGDRRAKLVQITDAGRAMPEQGLSLYDGIVARTFRSLTEEELAGLDAAILHLDRIVDQLEEEVGFRKGRVAPLRAEDGG